jgi:hypothetical protein
MGATYQLVGRCVKQVAIAGPEGGLPPAYGIRFSSGGGDAIFRRMDDKHPHDGATYAILRNADGTFGVEVKIPGANPIVISGLEGEAGAEKWIARHKETVAKGKPRRAFTRPKR